MKLFVIFALVAVAMAKPSAVFTPTFYAAAPLVAPVGTLNTLATAPVVSQYHSQDELGQYSYGYNGGSSAKSEIKSLDGVTRGAYSYVDAEGKLQSVEYTADAMNGFRATSSNMPVAPIETRTAPLPVQETAEVAKARADHMVAFEEAKVRAAAEPEMEEAKAEEIAPVVEAKSILTPAPIAPIAAPIAPIAAPLLRTENIATSPLAFSYAYSAPNFGYAAYPYHFGGYPYNYNYNFVRSALPVPFAGFPAPFIPQVIGETPEVARARAEHLAAHAEARARM